MRSGHEYNSTLHDLIQNACYAALDIVNNEINRRFEENDDIIRALCTAEKMEFDLLKPLAELHRVDLPNVNELMVAKSYIDSQRVSETGRENETASAAAAMEVDDEDDDDLDFQSAAEEEECKRKKVMSKNSIVKILYPVREAFPQTYKLFCALETFLCSTTISECLFSCLARVGILGRIHMTNQRLRELTFLAFEQKEAKSIETETILRHFNNKKKTQIATLLNEKKYTLNINTSTHSINTINLMKHSLISLF